MYSGNSTINKDKICIKGIIYKIRQPKGILKNNESNGNCIAQSSSNMKNTCFCRCIATFAVLYKNKEKYDWEFNAMNHFSVYNVNTKCVLLNVCLQCRHSSP